MTRADVLRTVAGDLDALVAAGPVSRWALVGGFALAVCGAPRSTLDIDALVEVPSGKAAEAAAALVRRGWQLVEHARHPDDPVPELLRLTCGGVPVDLIVVHRAWEAAMLDDAEPVEWQGVTVQCLRAEALAAMKLDAGGPQDLVDSERLTALPAFDRERYEMWLRKLGVRP